MNKTNNNNNNNNNNSHNGHMIKFQFFEKSSSLNCHFKNLGTYVVSIAHYMRAYFNYQALTHGNDFSLPGDVGFLNVSFTYCFYYLLITLGGLSSDDVARYIDVMFRVHVSRAPPSVPHGTHTVRLAEGDGHGQHAAIRQDRVPAPRHLHVNQAPAHRVHGQAVLERIQR